MLTPGEIERFRQRVEAALGDIQHALDVAADTDTGTVILDQSSVGRLSRMDALQQQAMAAGWKEPCCANNAASRPPGSGSAKAASAHAAGAAS